MGFFADIDDELTRDLNRDFTAIFQSIRDLTELLDVDSYAEMDDTHENAAKLIAQERELAKKLRHDLQETLPDAPDREILGTFLAAYRLEALYPDTVGDVAETASTIDLLTLPLFKARRLDAKVRERVVADLAKRFGIGDERLAAIEGMAEEAKQKLARRRELIDVVRTLLLDSDGTPKSRTELKAMFDRYFPENPLLEDEVEVVVTRTCVYWCIPMHQSARNEDVKAWLKNTGRFAFQYFSHFPTFSSFDARDADPELVAELTTSLGWSETDVIDGLNSTTTIERTPEIEKYLIHDTWGHMWQGDLTHLRQLYDRMESLKSPVDANEHLTLPDGNVVSLLDMIYLTARGRIRFDEGLAERYIDQWIRLRIQALLAPIVAELTADCVEYYFKLSNGEQGHLLPSSSMFSDNPAKLDFAWVDLGYFMRSLRRTNATYAKNEELRTNLIARICLLLKLKYPRQYKKIENADALTKEVSGVVDRFLVILTERQEHHLNQDLIAPEGNATTGANAFSLLFTNFLRVQFTLNQLIQSELENGRPHLAQLFNVLILFVVHHFERDPLHRFWNLDEVLGEYGLSVLAAIHEAEAN